MATLKVISVDGKSAGTTVVSDKLIIPNINRNAMRRAVLAEDANSRQGTQDTKERSDTRGGGRKPYKQKKTGRARQGTIRAPHYAHGGVALGPHPRDFSQKINRKERRLAILSALSAQIADGLVVTVDKIAFSEGKTKLAAGMLKSLGINERRVLVILASYDENALLSFRNLPNVVVRTAPNFSTRDLLVAHKIIAAKDAFKAMEEVWAK